MPKLYRWHFEKILQKLAEKVPAGSHVLDFACATGFRYRRYFEHCSYTGADICFEKDEEKIDERTTIRYADFNKNPFSDDQFDAIITTNSINYSGDDTKVIKNLNTLIDKCNSAPGYLITNINESYSDNLKMKYLECIKNRFEQVEIIKYQGKIAMFLSTCVDIAYKENRQVSGKYKDPIFSRIWVMFILKLVTPLAYYLIIRNTDIYSGNHGLMVYARNKIN